MLVEAYALAQRRLGMDAVRALATDFVPLVDCVNFEVMRRRDVSQVFAIDPDFAKQGFTVVP